MSASSPGKKKLSRADWCRLEPHAYRCIPGDTTRDVSFQSPSSRDTSLKGGFLPGTFAFAALTGDTPDCSATIQQWKEAFKNFSGVPPTYPNPLYDKRENISFIALYNPGTSTSPPAAYCRVVTCKAKPAGVPEASEPPTSPKKTGSAIVCGTTPDLLAEENAFFT